MAMKQLLKSWGAVTLPAVLFMLVHRLLAVGSFPGAVSSCILVPFIGYWYYKGEYKKYTHSSAAQWTGISPLLLLLSIVLGIALTSSFLLIQFDPNSINHSPVSAIQILGIAVAAPINEELIYRGMVFRRGQRVFGTATSLLFSSVLFGIAHTGLLQAGVCMVVGAVFVLIVLQYHNLTAAILVHIGVNLLSFCSTLDSLPYTAYIAGIFIFLVSVGILTAKILKSN